MKDEQQILEIRAMNLSQKFSVKVASEEDIFVVSFLLHPEYYAIEANYVKEVIPLKDITYIPGTPNFIVGVINYRGKMLSVINLKILFGMKELGLTALNKVIVLEGNQVHFGILADEITENLTIPSESLSVPPLTLGHQSFHYIKGVSREGLIILDGKSMLTSSQLVINQK